MQYNEVFIDSELKDGSLTYGEILIPATAADSDGKEIFLSTYVCHPQMANNELSGPVVTVFLAKWISELPERRYNYRIFFGPETIGAITYLSVHAEEMKKNIDAGFVVTCVGDDREFSYVESSYADTLADKAARMILEQEMEHYKVYPYLRRGSDERQYCTPLLRLPVCSVMRTKYGEYPEYHTSADDLSVVSEKGLQGALEIYQKIITALEFNKYWYKTAVMCEPQLGKRGLYSTLSRKGIQSFTRNYTNILSYLDGSNDIFDLSRITGVPAGEVIDIISLFMEHGLVSVLKEREPRC